MDENNIVVNEELTQEQPQEQVSPLLNEEPQDDCIFCKIVQGEIPCYKIYENEFVIAFLDIADDCIGHTLVIPKKHYINIFDVPEAEYLEVMKAVKKIAFHYVADCGFEGVNVINANGKSAQQSVFHLHFHILPRTSDDELNAWPDLEKQYQDFEAVHKKLRIE